MKNLMITMMTLLSLNNDKSYSHSVAKSLMLSLGEIKKENPTTCKVIDSLQCEQLGDAWHLFPNASEFNIMSVPT